MKKNSKKSLKVKYAGGTSIINYIEDPSEALAQNDINIAKAKYEAATDPLVLGLQGLAATSGYAGNLLGGNKAPGILASKLFANGGTINNPTKQVVNKPDTLFLDNTKGASDALLYLDMYKEAKSQGNSTMKQISHTGLYEKLEKLLENTTGKSVQSFDFNADSLSNQKDTYRPMPITYKKAEGGSIESNDYRSKVPVEVEGDEVGEMPNGQILEFNGPSHEQGGIDATLPEGTEIYSKRIQIDGKTMADRKKAREGILSRYTKKSDKGDFIAGNSLKRIKVATDKEEAFDRSVQDAIHQSLLAQNKTLVGREQHATNPVVGDVNKFWDSLPTLVDGRDNPLFPALESDSFNMTIPFNTSISDKLGVIPKTVPASMSVNNTPISPLTTEAEYESMQDVVDVKKGNGFQFTGGDFLNMAGNIYQGVTPYLSALKNRSNDTVTPNYMQEYGKEGLNKLAEGEQFLKQNLDESLKTLESNRVSATKQGRNSARGVNTMRALDLATYEGANKQQGSLYANYANQMTLQLAREAQAEDMQDRMVMTGREQADNANEMKRDMSDVAIRDAQMGIGKTIANAGGQWNNALQRDNIYDLLDTNNFEFNPSTNKVIGKHIAKLESKIAKNPEMSSSSNSVEANFSESLKKGWDRSSEMKTKFNNDYSKFLEYYTKLDINSLEFKDLDKILALGQTK